jgi:transposase
VTKSSHNHRRAPRTGQQRLPTRGRPRECDRAAVADRGYAGELVNWARERLWLTLRIVSRPKGTKGFVVLPRRWKVERKIGWCMNARRNARDYERLPQHSEAHLNWALITLMTRRLTRKKPAPSWTKEQAPTG